MKAVNRTATVEDLQPPFKVNQLSTSGKDTYGGINNKLLTNALRILNLIKNY